MRVRNVRLTVTEKCNLTCVYCYEKHKSSRYMSIMTAKEIVDNETARISEIDQLNFEFFGGEPFLNFPLIKTVSEYIWNKRLAINVSLSAVTNGTAFSDFAKEWLFEHQDRFDLGFSIDGNKQTQDENRNNSYDLLDFDFLSRYPRASIKMTISPSGVSRLAEDVMYLHSFSCPVGCNIDYDANWIIDDDLLNQFSNQLSKLIAFYQEHPQLSPCSVLNMPVKTVLSSPISYILPPCGAGTTVKSYSCDGQVYPCQGFMPLTCGKEHENEGKNIDFQDKIPLTLLDQDCQTCPIVNSCPNCFASNFFQRGCIYKKNLNYCRLIKLFYKASAFLLFKRLESGAVRLSSEDEARTLRGIKIIQEQFQ